MGTLAEFIQEHADAADVAATVRALSALTDPAHEGARDTGLHELTDDDRAEAGRLMCDLIELANALESLQEGKHGQLGGDGRAVGR